MSEAHDPAGTGVKAGRVVGVLTAPFVVWALLGEAETVRTQLEWYAALVGLDHETGVRVYFWLTVAGSALGRFAFCYVVGSLLGVVYDWLDQPSLWALAPLVVAVGLVDGGLSGFGFGRPLLGLAYFLAWLCFLPAFARWHEDGDARRSRPTRLG